MYKITYIENNGLYDESKETMKEVLEFETSLLIVGKTPLCIYQICANGEIVILADYMNVSLEETYVEELPYTQSLRGR